MLLNINVNIIFTYFFIIIILHAYDTHIFVSLPWESNPHPENTLIYQLGPIITYNTVHQTLATLLDNAIR